MKTFKEVSFLQQQQKNGQTQRNDCLINTSTKIRVFVCRQKFSFFVKKKLKYIIFCTPMAPRSHGAKP